MDCPKLPGRTLTTRGLDRQAAGLRIPIAILDRRTALGKFVA
jgi:hypothetical protein